MGLREGLIKFFVDKGGRAAMVRWPDVEQRIITVKNRQQVELAEPEDDLWDYSLYCETFGDPKYNGRGHRETWDYGKHEVVVPSAPIRKIKRPTARVREQAKRT